MPDLAQIFAAMGPMPAAQLLDFDRLVAGMMNGHFVAEDAASQAAGQGNVDCTDCKDCRGCEGCKDCRGYKECRGCKDCRDCNDCVDCVNCGGVLGLSGCTRCQGKAYVEGRHIMGIMGRAKILRK